mmetsp:Transcript_60192/g.166595  ORF Transcript_60192/g.166595 Transcript_60192/m.166595 type:complete len:301 (-) Transcript_60192:2027-2929(-)
MRAVLHLHPVARKLLGEILWLLLELGNDGLPVLVKALARQTLAFGGFFQAVGTTLRKVGVLHGLAELLDLAHADPGFGFALHQIEQLDLVGVLRCLRRHDVAQLLLGAQLVEELLRDDLTVDRGEHPRGHRGAADLQRQHGRPVRLLRVGTGLAGREMVAVLQEEGLLGWHALERAARAIAIRSLSQRVHVPGKVVREQGFRLRPLHVAHHQALGVVGVFGKELPTHPVQLLALQLVERFQLLQEEPVVLVLDPPLQAHGLHVGRALGGGVHQVPLQPLVHQLEGVGRHSVHGHRLLHQG